MDHSLTDFSNKVATYRESLTKVMTKNVSSTPHNERNRTDNFRGDRH